MSWANAMPGPHMQGPPPTEGQPGFNGVQGQPIFSPPQPPAPPQHLGRAVSLPRGGGGKGGAAQHSASQREPHSWGQTYPHLNAPPSTTSWTCGTCQTIWDSSHHCQCWQQWINEYNSQPVGATPTKPRAKRNQSRNRRAQQQLQQQ